MILENPEEVDAADVDYSKLPKPGDIRRSLGDH